MNANSIIPQSNSYSSNYADLQPPIIGGHYVFVDPSSPVRTEKTLAEINARDDDAGLGTQLFFGHPFTVLEHTQGNSYAGIQLPTYGYDPLPQDSFSLAIEAHKMRINISQDEMLALTRNPAYVVISELGLRVVDQATNTEHKLLFGSRIPNYDSHGIFTLGESGNNSRTYRIIDNPTDKLGVCSADGATVAELVKRAAVFEGANFMWGTASSQFSDASGWISNLYRSFGVNFPHNTKRIQQFLSNGSNEHQFGHEISSLTELTTGDLVFIGMPSKNISFMGMVNIGSEGQLKLQFCAGKGGMQYDKFIPANSAVQSTDIISENCIVGLPGREIKAAWRVLELEK
jgi:hypothetical protein